jgi:hypothetical protein
VRFVSDVVVSVGVRVHVGDKGEEPVFHVRGDGGVICVCDGDR